MKWSSLRYYVDMLRHIVGGLGATPGKFRILGLQVVLDANLLDNNVYIIRMEIHIIDIYNIIIFIIMHNCNSEFILL